MKELLDAMEARLELLNNEEQTEENIGRRRELTLAIVKLQQLLLPHLKSTKVCPHCGMIRKWNIELKD